MSFEGVIINKLNGGLGRGADNPDRVICLVCGCTDSEQVIYKKAIPLLDITAAETLGITAASDANNAELTHYHLSEMFRLCPGFTYYLLPVAKETTVAQLVADADVLSALRGVKDLNVIGIAGMASATVPAISADILALQGLVNTFATEHLLIDGIILEGVGQSQRLPIPDYPDLRALTAENISVVIAQDPAQAALNEAYHVRAAVGTVLGSIAVRAVHEDLGSVDVENKPGTRKGQESYSLSDQISGRWLSAALSDGTPFASLTPAQQKNLSGKGYIYAGAFADYDGFYLSGCPTAVQKSSDYAYFNYNCIWNKAARIIRKTLIPKVRSKVPTDSATGEIKSTWVSSCEGLVKQRLETMISAGNIEAADVSINPAQTVSEDTPLLIKAQVVVGQIVHEFEVDLGLTSKIE
ncbi:hypothetical protein EZS27_005332 [termite gut metagenome]|uniref:DUF2586 family protein n=1 Tax=termite gut metagenome TaxID=433724 RepID=A0A5J4SP57_9ZZZZ